MTISVYYPCWNELLSVGSGSIKVSVCHGQSVWMLVGVPITSEFPLVLLISVAVCVKIHSAHISQATHENSLSNNFFIVPFSKVHCVDTKCHHDHVTVVTSLSAFSRSAHSSSLLTPTQLLMACTGLWPLEDH